MRVQLQVAILSDTSENFRCAVYRSAGTGQGWLRTNPIDFVEERYRTSGPSVRLSVSGTFCKLVSCRDVVWTERARRRHLCAHAEP